MLFYKDLFKTYRQTKGYTHKEIGEKLGITEQAVQQWESGETKPRSKNVIKLAKILGISVIDISDMKPEKEFIEYMQDTERKFVAEERAAYFAEFKKQNPCPLTDSDCPFRTGSRILKTLVEEILEMNDDRMYTILQSRVVELKHEKNTGGGGKDAKSLDHEKPAANIA